jgi:16S rRNA C1402 (ribose-2'-O) methylase RsmI
MQVILDTPYRLKNLLQDLFDLQISRTIFLACNLGRNNQKLFRGNIREIKKVNLGALKEEFVLIIGNQDDD